MICAHFSNQQEKTEKPRVTYNNAIQPNVDNKYECKEFRFSSKNSVNMNIILHVISILKSGVQQLLH